MNALGACLAGPPQSAEEEKRQVNERKMSPMLNVTLQLWPIHLTTDETFGIEDYVGRIRMEHIFGRVTDPSFEVSAKVKGKTHEESSQLPLHL